MDMFALASHVRSFMQRNAGLRAVVVGLVVLFGAMITVRPAAGQFRDVGYTLEPGVQGIFEDDAGDQGEGESEGEEQDRQGGEPGP